MLFRSNVLAYFIMCFGPCDILHSDNGPEFMGAALHIQQRTGIRIIKGAPRHPQSQGSVEQANGVVKQRIAAWKATTGLENWDIALIEIAIQINHTVSEGHNAIPYEVEFNAKSRVRLDQWVPHSQRPHIRL